MNEAKTLPLGRILIGTTLFFAAVHFCFSAGWKTMGGAIIGLPLLGVLFMPAKQTPTFLFYYLCMCFSVANRTFFLGDIFRIYNQELIVLFLFLYVVFTQRSTHEKSMIPLAGKVFAILTVLGIITAMNNETLKFDEALFYAKGILLFLPLFFCVHRIVSSERVLQTACIFLVSAVAVSSLMSIADYFGLGIAKMLFGETEKEVFARYREEQMLEFETPFFRVSDIHVLASFMAASVYLIFFLTFYLYGALKSQKLRIFLRVAQVFSLLYVFYSGYRSIWIAFVISLTLYGIHQGRRGLIGLSLFALIVGALLPTAAVERLEGLYGEEQDSSVKKRIERTELAIQAVQEEPLLGRGWSSTGLIHNDFLQIAADSGIATLIAFLLFYGSVLVRLYLKFWQARRQGHRLESHCLITFFSALAGYLFIFMSGSHFNVQETFIAFWLMLALGAKATYLPIGESADMESERDSHTARFAA